MDLEVVGRHALFFDDDNSASFVNSPDALVEWNSLSIDRYDVRHLLPVPLPPRTRRRHPHPDASLESDLDLERYRDLPEEKREDEEKQHQDAGNDSDVPNTGAYHNVGFAYGDPNESSEQKTTDAEIVFRPAFPVPESLILPSTEKIHQIIARTATFVAKHGGQSEIVLRVKQGDNPMFGFLMPDHNLHVYFRYLVDHQELLEQDNPGISVQKEKTNGARDHTGGALSLLGSVYDSGEDDDDTTEEASVSQKMDSPENVGSTRATVHGSEQKESTGIGKNSIIPKVPCPPLKEKVNLIKHNRITSTVKGGAAGGIKKESDVWGPLDAAPSKSQASTMPSASKLELPILEPPSDQRRVVEKIVEFILKNGREFEVVLAEQNCKQGRFLFLLPSNRYHPYYLKVLQDAQKVVSVEPLQSNLRGNHFISEKQDSAVGVVDKKAAKSSDAIISGSAGNEIPFDYDKKEKFKMVIGKSKKDVQDLPSKSNQPEVGFSVDEVATILQAATRGIKKPGLDIFSKPSSSGAAQGSINDGGQDLSSGSQKGYISSGAGQVSQVPVPVAKAIAETAALVAAREADSSEASLTKEQKLKVERLKRAKMFAAMIKGGSAPLKTDLYRGLSAEPPEIGVTSSGNKVSDLATKEREGSSAAVDGDVSDKLEEYGKKSVNESRSKKCYRNLSKRIGEEDGENQEEDTNDHKHHKKRRAHHSSDNGKDSHRHKRYSSSKDTDSRRRHRHESTDLKHRHSRSKHTNDSSEDEHQPSKRQRHRSTSDDDHWVSDHHDTQRQHLTSRARHKHRDTSVERHHSRSRHNRGNSSEGRHRRTALKQRESKTEKDLGLEEGEIFLKSDQSLACGVEKASKEASVDITKSDEIERAPSQPTSAATVVSDDLRAKIRAMLMATL